MGRRKVRTDIGKHKNEELGVDRSIGKERRK